jgi:hypothetical protein
MSSEKAEDKYEFTEDETVEIIKLLRSWRKKLFKHPESQDHIYLLQCEEYFVKKLTDILKKRYFKEKGLE